MAKAQRCKFTAEYKLGLVAEADHATDPGGVGALLRREGLYSSHLVEWRRLRETGALGALSKKRGRQPTRNPLAEENCKLKAELLQVKKKLQQAEIIIDVQKKSRPCWGSRCRRRAGKRATRDGRHATVDLGRRRGGLPRSGSSAGLLLPGASATTRVGC